MSRFVTVSEITISWKITSDSPPDTIYYLNDIEVGLNDIGFDKILEHLSISKTSKVIIKMTGEFPLDSGSLERSLPFYNRIDEFNNALNKKDLVYKFF